MKQIQRTRFRGGIFWLILVALMSCWTQEAWAQGFEDVGDPGESARLPELSKFYRERWMREYAEAEHKAKELGLPIRGTLKGGISFSLRRINEFGILEYNWTRNLNAAKTISTNRVWPGGGAGLNLTGSGETLGVWDVGHVRIEHQEFAPAGGGASRAWFGDAFPPFIPASYDDHATHVGGTMVAAGHAAPNGDPDAKGMAYQANLISWEANNDHAEMAAAAENPLRVSNHSYGPDPGWNASGVLGMDWAGPPAAADDPAFGYYDTDVQSYDMTAFNAPKYLIVVAAGNDRNDGPGAVVPHTHNGALDPMGNPWMCAHNDDGGALGYDCVSGSAVAKNVLAVGAVEDIPAGYVNAAGVAITAFSSWGPTDDGRIKPDLVANGENVYSTVAYTSPPPPGVPALATNEYDTYSGTSMASPNIAGSVGLLLQHLRTLRPGIEYRSATWRALLIHTADEAGANAGPDYAYGWGLMNTRSAAQVMSETNPCQHIAEYKMNQVDSAGNDTAYIMIQSNGGRLKVTAAWTDPAGTPVAPVVLNPPDLMLVNDLDFRVVDAAGAVVGQPWRLNPANPANAATKGDNHRDNVEKIETDSLAAGFYWVRVTYKNGALQGGSQRFSLIVTGNADIVNLALAGYTIAQPARVFFRASNSLSAANFIIQPPSNVTFTAGSSITLAPGFHAQAGCVFHAKVAPCNNAEVPKYAPLVEETGGAITGEEGHDASSLTSSWPNPFNSSATITYIVREALPVSITVSDMYGRQVAELIDVEEHASGIFNVTLDGTSLTSGTYFYTYRAGTHVETKKIVLVK